MLVRNGQLETELQSTKSEAEQKAALEEQQAALQEQKAALEESMQQLAERCAVNCLCGGGSCGGDDD